MKEKDRCTMKTHRTEDSKQNCIKRLNRINGQIKGITKMIDEDRCCDDILMQVSASIEALKSLSYEILLNHMKTCMVDDIKNNKLDTIDEVLEFSRRLK